MSSISSSQHSTPKQQAYRRASHACASRGFEVKGFLATTLQGTVWEAIDLNAAEGTGDRVVVKMTDRVLHNNGITTADNHSVPVLENIVSEASILRFLSGCTDFPKSIVAFTDCFKTRRNYYVVEQYGGMSLLDFVIKCHKLITDGRMTIEHWKRAVHAIFRQMMECVQFIHSKNVAHFDLSLENFLINDIAMDDTFADKNIHIKLCDFGLAGKFAVGSCQSIKYCGKRGYKSPEVTHADGAFDAKKNDIFCLGVSLFMMSIGCGPFSMAHESDPLYCLIVKGQLLNVLLSWGKAEYADKKLLNLLASIFRLEINRITLNQIDDHNWMKKR